MFDISFSEWLVIGIVALVVIGPERLPKVARTAGHLFGRLQRYVAGVKADIAREMELDELRKFKTEVENTARSMEANIQQEISLAEQEINSLQKGVEKTSEMDPTKLGNTNVADLSRDLTESTAESAPSPTMHLALDHDAARKSSPHE